MLNVAFYCHVKSAFYRYKTTEDSLVSICPQIIDLSHLLIGSSLIQVNTGAVALTPGSFVQIHINSAAEFHIGFVDAKPFLALTLAFFFFYQLPANSY